LFPKSFWGIRCKQITPSLMTMFSSTLHVGIWGGGGG
jgi:hypothetical protein